MHEQLEEGILQEQALGKVLIHTSKSGPRDITQMAGPPKHGFPCLLPPFPLDMSMLSLVLQLYPAPSFP